MMPEESELENHNSETDEHQFELSQEASKETLKVESLSDLQKICLSLIANAKYSLQIYSPLLDPRVLNNRDIERRLNLAIRNNRNFRVEILIRDEKAVQGQDHRLVSLSQNYTSFAKIKLIPKDFYENPFAFYLIDGRLLIYRTYADRYESSIHELPDSKIIEKAKYFKEVWEQASPAVHLRALHL
ncbi:hypothetical protein [Aliikangiella sp. G2MR2-5]|uniref:DUF7931 domain-containing protein n=1 Tax=Aliikangiella sp. G2MR2-5 TaxID=2788943 RepID=UPI0018A99215|nr:hypothetical protein [Aliikangiella sp. G2MR2-5]